MTDQEWKTVDEKLSKLGNHVKLAVDDYNIDLVLLPVSRWKNAIIVTINGELGTIYHDLDCEERRRFLKHKRTCILKNKDFRRMGISNVHLVERLRKEYTIDLYSPLWTDFRAMKKHFTENNKSIELISV